MVVPLLRRPCHQCRHRHPHLYVRNLVFMELRLRHRHQLRFLVHRFLRVRVCEFRNRHRVPLQILWIWSITSSPASCPTSRRTALSSAAPRDGILEPPLDLSVECLQSSSTGLGSLDGEGTQPTPPMLFSIGESNPRAASLDHCTEPGVHNGMAALDGTESASLVTEPRVHNGNADFSVTGEICFCAGSPQRQWECDPAPRGQLARLHFR